MHRHLFVKVTHFSLSHQLSVCLSLSISLSMLTCHHYRGSSYTDPSFLARLRISHAKGVLGMTLNCMRRSPWCNGYRRRKWTRRHEFKSWTRMIAFHTALIPLGKVWIQLFSLQLWVNSRDRLGSSALVEQLV